MRALGRCWAAVSDVFTAVPADAPPGRPPTAGPPTPDGDGAAPAGDPPDFATRLSTQLSRRRGRLAAACLVTALGPAVVAQAGSLGAGAQGAPPAGGPPAVDHLPVPVPGETVTWFPVARRAAATCPGLPSAVLVAIGHVESSLGLQTGTSAAGAVGPMQFLPSTWAAYAADGDGDGRTDVMNPIDAVHGAARLLCANGGADPERLASALWNYNHSDEYVRQVMAFARFIPVGT